MGNSTINIPSHLVSPLMQFNFLNWVRAQQCEESAKRYLLSTWSKHTGKTLHINDFQWALGKRMDHS